MFLLYIDESGNENDPSDTHFVLGGAAVFDRVAFFLSQAFEGIQAKHFPGLPPVAFHASQIRSGKGFWRKIPAETKADVLTDLAGALERANKPGVILFAAVVEKSAKLHGEAAVEHATAELTRRFDLFLKRKYREDGQPERGLLIFAEGRFHQRARLWVQRFRELGTRWGSIHNLADIPYFASANETRLLQVADFVAHGVFMLYERRDPSLIGRLLNRFDRRDGILHGLVHHRPTVAGDCDCPSCFSRRTPGALGPWVDKLGA